MFKANKNSVRYHNVIGYWLMTFARIEPVAKMRGKNAIKSIWCLENWLSYFPKRISYGCHIFHAVLFQFSEILVK